MQKDPPIYSWKPRNWQAEVLSGLKQTTVVRCSRRAGKTDLVSAIAASSFLDNPKTDICLASFTLKNARQVLFERLIYMLSPLPSYVKHVKAENMMINEKSGSSIRLFGLSAEHGNSIRGFSFDLAVLDEYSLIPYDIFVNAFSPTLLDTNGWLLAISTPRGSFDLMSMLEAECDEPLNEKTHTRFHFPASSLIGQVPNLTNEFLELQRKRNSLSYQLEYEADISASSADTIFDHKLLTKAITYEAPYTSDSLVVSGGLDFAPRRDKSVLTVRNSKNFIGQHELNYDGNPRSFIKELKNYVRMYNIRKLALDRGGAGEVISDLVENDLCNYYPIEDVRGVISGESPFHESNYNLRAELVAMLRDFITINKNTISTQLPHHKQLCSQLSATLQKPNSNGKFQVISKELIKQVIGCSPDYADSACLSLYFERDDAMWKKPVSELTARDLSDMSDREIMENYAEFY